MLRPLMDWPSGEVHAVELDTSSIGGHKTHDHVKTGGLACAIWAKKPNDFARFNRERDIADHGAALIALLKVLNIENRVFAKCSLKAHGLDGELVEGLDRGGAGEVGVWAGRGMSVMRVRGCPGVDSTR